MKNRHNNFTDEFEGTPLSWKETLLAIILFTGIGVVMFWLVPIILNH